MQQDFVLPQQLSFIDGCSFQAVFTGSDVNGTLKLQASLNYDPRLGTGDWDDVTGSTFTITTAGSKMWNFPMVMFPYIRLVWVDGGSSLDSRLSVWFYGRGQS